MRIQLLTATVFLSGFIAASAFAFEIKPGEWEFQTSDESGKVTNTVKFCISPEQAKTLFQPSGIANANASKDCKTTSSTSGGVTSYQVKCDGNGSKIEAQGTVKMLNENEMQNEQTMTVSFSGQPPVKSEMKGKVKKISDTEIISTSTTTSSAVKGVDQTTSRQKFISATCGKDAMPFGGGV
jgi:hypothetical protein